MCLWGPQDVVAEHKRRYRIQHLVEQIERSRLEIIDRYYFNFLLFLPILMARRTLRLFSVSIRSENDLNFGLMNLVLNGVFDFDTWSAPLRQATVRRFDSGTLQEAGRSDAGHGTEIMDAPSALDTKISTRTSLFEFAIIAILATILALVARLAFPQWDDSIFWILSRHGGPQAIIEQSPDRPIMLTAWAWMDQHRLLWSGGLVVHWLCWFGIAVVTLCLWKLLFPARRGFAIAAACLAITPALCGFQFVIVNPVFTGMVGPVLVWLCLLPLLQQARGGEISHG